MKKVTTKLDFKKKGKLQVKDYERIIRITY